jgi:hypothetical protein
MSLAARRALAAVLAGALYFCLLLGAGWDDSATFDEPVHIMSGYLTNVWGDYQVNNFHPPLAKSVAALPLSFHPPSLVKSDVVHPGRSVELAKAWFWHTDRDPQTMLRDCRTSLYLFQALLLSALLYLVAERAGSTLAAAALALLAFASPAVLGVSLYVTTDACLALFLLLGLAVYQRLERWGRKRDLVLLTLVMGGGLSSKHPFLLLPAVLVALLFFRTLHAARFSPQKVGHLKTLLGKVTLAAMGGLVLTLALYSFSMRGMSSGEVERSLQRMAGFGSPPFRATLAWTAEHEWLYPLGWYLSGLNRSQHYLGHGWGLSTSVLGQVYQGGRWYYFPLIIAAKENVGVLLLLGWLWFAAVRNWPRNTAENVDLLPALTLASTYFIIASASSLNIGFRHIAPSYLCLLYASAQILPRVIGGKAALLKALLVLALLRIWSLSTTFPHYLSYYNVLAGGVKGGYRVSVISDADWGQDLLRLGRYLQQHKATRTHLFYAATADPLYYAGPSLVDDGDFRPGDFVAVSTTFVEIPSYLDPKSRSRVERALDWPPLAQIGGSFLVFQVPLLSQDTHSP